jgi:hypothetical protein
VQLLKVFLLLEEDEAEQRLKVACRVQGGTIARAVLQRAAEAAAAAAATVSQNAPAVWHACWLVTDNLKRYPLHLSYQL